MGSEFGEGAKESSIGLEVGGEVPPALCEQAGGCPEEIVMSETDVVDVEPVEESVSEEPEATTVSDAVEAARPEDVKDAMRVQNRATTARKQDLKYCHLK